MSSLIMLIYSERIYLLCQFFMEQSNLLIVITRNGKICYCKKSCTVILAAW